MAPPSSAKPPSSSMSLSAPQHRIAAHTHITGLGLNAQGLLDDDTTSSCGLIGQSQARQACGLVCDLVQAGKLAGRAVLLTGPPGSGKTALAMAMAKELGQGVPFTPMVASAVYSKEIRKTAVLQAYFRKSIGVRISEQKEVYEGQVTALTAQETEDPLTTYGRTISHVVLTLKTTKGSQTLKLDPIMYDALQAAKVTIGDVMYIEANSGTVKRVGRSDAYATEFDLEAEEYVSIPKGNVQKQKKIVQHVTLHDLDLANAQPAAGGNKKDVASLLQQLSTTGGRPRQPEITDKLRNEINQLVTEYCKQGIAELTPGILFIDEVHMLDRECFTFLNAALESPLAPIVVLATNRGVTAVRESGGQQQQQELAPHGVPVDVLDRLLIIPTQVYDLQELQDILRVKSKAEQLLEIHDDALRELATIAYKTSLRYAVQLMMPAHFMAATAGRSDIQLCDVQAMDDLFLDAKASASKLQDGVVMMK